MDRMRRQKYKMILMLFMTASFCLTELVYGHITGSLALIGDAYHMLADVLSLIVGLSSLTISLRSSTRNTFGLARAEILGALVNSVFLATLCFTIFTEALERLVDPAEIADPQALLIVGIVGLAVNIVGLLLFWGETSANPRLRNVGISDDLESLSSSRDSKSDGGEESAKKKKKVSFKPINNSNDWSGRKTTGQHSAAPSREPGRDPPATKKVKLEVRDEAAEAPPLEDSGQLPTDSSSVPLDQGDFTVGRLSEPLPEFHSEAKDCRPSDKPQQTKDFNDGERTITDHPNVNFNHTGEQMNIKGVFLHLFGDALGSIGVITSALVTIYYPKRAWTDYADPILSLIIVAIILSTTIPLFRRSSLVLMQHVPANIKIDDLADLLEAVNGVLNVHELHIWQLVGSKLIASVHVKCRGAKDYVRIAKEMNRIFHNKGIHSFTIQPEFLEVIPKKVDGKCLMSCEGTDCINDRCCPFNYDD